MALKTRSCEPAVAVEQSLATWQWLRRHGVPRVFFKYCSTFDSTPRGNIGPVAEALLAASGGRDNDRLSGVFPTTRGQCIRATFSSAGGCFPNRAWSDIRSIR